MDFNSRRAPTQATCGAASEKPVWRGHSCPRANATRQLKVRNLETDLKDLSPRAKRGICIFSPQRFSFPIDRFPRNTRIFNLGVPISKAPPLFFLILRRGNALSGFVKKFLQTIGHNSPLGHMHLTTGGAKENPTSLASGTRVLPAHPILAQAVCDAVSEEPV